MTLHYFGLFCAGIGFLLLTAWLWQVILKIRELQRSIKCWEEDAARFYRNECYYRELVQRCGKVFGIAAHQCDDGVSVSQDVLCAKVPELVEELWQRLCVAQDALDQSRQSLHTAVSLKLAAQDELERVRGELQDSQRIEDATP